MANRARITLLVLLAFGVSLLGTPVSAAPQWTKGIVEDRLSQRLEGREVHIGKLEIDWGLPLGLQLYDVRIGNASWASHPQMFTAKRVDLQLGVGDLVFGNLDFQRVELSQPVVHLARQADGTANWTVFKSKKKKKGKGFQPESLLVHGGRVTLDDARLDAEVAMQLSTGGEPGSGQRTLQLTGDGHLKGRTLSFTATGGPPSRALDESTPYALEARGSLGQIDFRLDGEARELMQLDGLQAQVSLSAPETAQLPRPLANTLEVPAFELRARVSRDGPRWAVQNLRLDAGKTRLGGELLYEKGPTPQLDLQLAANQLDLDRWGVMNLLHGSGAEDASPGPGPAAADRADAADWQQAASDLLQPLRRYRGQVDIQVGTLSYGQTQLRELAARGRLTDTGLHIQRLHAVQDDGELSAEGDLQFGAGPLTGQLDARIERFDLGEALAPFGLAQLGTLEGEVHAALAEDAMSIRDTRLDYDARAQDLSLQAQVRTHGQAGTQVEGSGTRHGEPFRFDLTLGQPLALLQPDEPFPVQGTLFSQGTSVRLNGSVRRPFQLEGIDTQFAIDGQNPARLATLTGVNLPTLPPYEAEGHLLWNDPLLQVQNLDARIGQSDLHGDIRARLVERPMLWATLHSRQLRVSDVRPLKAVTTHPVTRDPSVFSKNPWKLDVLRKFDAKIDYSADDLVAKDIPLQAVQLDITLDQGVLRIAPLDVGLGGGQAGGRLVLDAHRSPADARLDLSIRQVNLKPLLRKADLPDIARDTAGVLGGEVHVQGTGNSMDALMADLDGEVELATSGGRLDMLVVELLGLDPGEALVGYVSKSDSVPMRCAYIKAQARQGVTRIQQFFVATADSNFTGGGVIHLGQESLDLRIEAHPKDFSVFSSDSPILVQGSLSHPQVSLLSGELLARGFASLVGAVVAPPLAILPWVEPGLGEGSGMGCSAALREFKEDAQRR